MPRRPRFLKPARPAPVLQAEAESKAERDRFYTGVRWRRCRAAFLAKNPLCVDCEAEATIPHHDKERLHRPDLAYDLDNLVALCSPCHSRRHKQREANP